jgi:hypothetical protein
MRGESLKISSAWTWVLIKVNVDLVKTPSQLFFLGGVLQMRVRVMVRVYFSCAGHYAYGINTWG